MIAKPSLRATVLIALGALATLSALQAGGVCVKQQRYWTDSQLIEVAVRDLASEVHRDPQGLQWKPMQIEGTEEDVAEFLRAHPDCCSVDRSPEYRSFVDVVFGWNAPEVRISFERNRADPKARLEPYYTKWIAVSTCGEIRKHTRGWGSHKPGYP